MKVISAGLPRSGSTLLFNILREFLKETYGDRLVSFWCKSPPPHIPENSIQLIKTHRLIREYRQNTTIFFTYRDIRDIAVSAYRMFDYPISMQTLRSYVREYCVARACKAWMISYEDLTELGVLVTAWIGERLPSSADPYQIYLRAEADMKIVGEQTQVHPGHVKNTRSGEWLRVIPAEIQQAMQKEFAPFFEETGYLWL